MYVMTVELSFALLPDDDRMVVTASPERGAPMTCTPMPMAFHSDIAAPRLHGHGDDPHVGYAPARGDTRQVSGRRRSPTCMSESTRSSAPLSSRDAARRTPHKTGEMGLITNDR